ncbi:uncharacterized protein [Solanum lycopersicum]|uniref:uncharacterized protein n=1 Tax=Solanum lycopersicum TaxID=4081 RepID=UPI00374A91A1
MAPYEALYGRKCRSPIGWFDVGDTKLIVPDLVQQAVDKVKLIQERLLATRVDRSHLQIIGIEIWSFKLSIPVDDVQVTEELSYEEKPIAILDRQVRRLCTKDVASVKVLWQNNDREEITWEAEDEMKNKYPYFFLVPAGNSIPSLTLLIDKRDYVVTCNSVRHL